MGLPAVLRVDIVTDARQVGGGVNQATGSLGKLGSTAAKVGKVAGAGLAIAGLAAGKFALDSIGAASEVEQAYGALDTVYGKNAKAVKRWAEGAADSVGLAKGEYANLASLVGAQLQGMGFEQDKSAKRTKGLIGLGADLAATYGGSVSDAVGAVSSVLKGETDPIERYGVSIKAADVSARLAAQGLDGLTGKAEKQARAQATLELLTKQTTKAQGAFSRESNTLAGQQERLAAKFENVKATIGEKLLPIATRLTTWASEKALPKLGQLGRFLADKLGPVFRRVGAFITDDLVPAGQRFYHWFVQEIAPGLRRTLEPVLDAAQKAFDKVRGAIEDNEPELRTLGNALREVGEFIAQKVLPIVGRLAGFFVGRFADSITDVIDFVADLVGWIDRAVQGIQDLIGWIQDIDIPDIDIPGLRIAGPVTEVVMPVMPWGGRTTAGAGAGDTVNIHLPLLSGLTPDLIRLLIRAIDDWYRAQGKRVELVSV